MNSEGGNLLLNTESLRMAGSAIYNIRSIKLYIHRESEAGFRLYKFIRGCTGLRLK